MSVTLNEIIEKGQPQDDFALVERVKNENVTPQGIHLPGNVGDVYIVRVLKVGPGGTLMSGERKKPTVKAGDYAIMAPDHRIQPLKFMSVSKVGPDGKREAPDCELMLVETHFFTYVWTPAD